MVFKMIFYLFALILIILWFIDEIITIKDILKYDVSSQSNKVMTWALKHHPQYLIYGKTIIMGIFIYFSSTHPNLELFFSLELLAGISYLIFDINYMSGIERSYNKLYKRS